MRNCNLDETDLKTEEENQWVDVDVDEDDDADAKVWQTKSPLPF